MVDITSTIISNANNIEKNKVIQTVNDMLEPTKAKGGNVVDLLKKIIDGILKDPSGIAAKNIINIANQP